MLNTGSLYTLASMVILFLQNLTRSRNVRLIRHLAFRIMEDAVAVGDSLNLHAIASP